MRDLVGGFKSIPVDRGNPHTLIVGVENLVPAGVPVTSPLAERQRRNENQPDY